MYTNIREHFLVLITSQPHQYILHHKQTLDNSIHEVPYPLQSTSKDMSPFGFITMLLVSL